MVARERHAIEESLRKKIEQRAYEIWENEGGPHGRDMDHWLRAEAEIMRSMATPTPSKAQGPLHSKRKLKRQSTGRTRDLRGRKASRP